MSRGIYDFCTFNRASIARAAQIGCFQCLYLRVPSDIREWMSEALHRPDPHGETALCPKCGFDFVLASEDIRLDQDTLKKIHEREFSAP